MKQRTILSTGSIIAIVAATFTGLTARADTTTFSGKGAFGELFGAIGTLRMNVNAFEGVTKSKSQSENQAGADFFGYNNTADACWYGYAATNSIEFDASSTGHITNNLTASGSALMTWRDWCGHNNTFTEVVTFYMDLSAITNQTYTRSGTENAEYGNIKANSHFAFSSSHAAFDSSSYITSPRFGTIAPYNADLGQSRLHDVEITQP